MNHKVVVTGIDIISPLGLNVDENWKNMVAGQSGIKKISLFNANDLDTQIAGEVPPEFDEYYKKYIKKRAAKQMTRVTRMCIAATNHAIEAYQIPIHEIDKSRIAIVLGVVNTGNSSVEKGTDLSNTILKGMNNAMSAWISMEYRITGPNFTVSTACASSAYAIAIGYDFIASGNYDMVITGGADSIINPEEIKGFNNLYALSTQNSQPEKASKPFSKDRDGFVIGEGAGVVILESKSHAEKRKAKILAELMGHGISSEAYNIMSPRAEGLGMLNTMKTALSNSGLKPEKIDYINAHGTSTMLNDLYETMAIKTLFGEHSKNLHISGSKSMIGHTIGAAGAIEAAITIKSLEEGLITPTINLDVPDPELDLNYTPHKTVKKNIQYALTNSFGFGGHNASLVLKKYN